MVRSKQIRPKRSGGIVDGELEGSNASRKGTSELSDQGKPQYVEIDRTRWGEDEHFDISEVVLMNLKISEEFHGRKIREEMNYESVYNLRFRFGNVNGYNTSRIKFGNWPVLSASDIYIELIEKLVGDGEPRVVVMGSLDGPDKGVSGLVHLASMKFLTLRPLLGEIFTKSLASVRLRVEIQKSAFDACKSLFDDTRQHWKKSMINVMAWLRPEVMTSEAIYKVPEGMEIEVEPNADSSAPKKRATFDVAGFYEAIKPSKHEPMLKDDIPGLLPKLRPYQRRAAYWMVQQEKGTSGNSGGSELSHSASPFCIPMDLIDSSSKIYYNPFSGSVSVNPEHSTFEVFGGILADEMGLGKTIELLACIFANRRSEADVGDMPDEAKQATKEQKFKLRRMKRERIECVCGAVSESSKYEGLWVQCDVCDAWQHADCVGYPEQPPTSGSTEDSEKKSLTGDSRGNRRKKEHEIVVHEEAHICPLCSELIQAANSPVGTGATLVVCPAPILAQWHSEISRHTEPGSLKILVYEGLRNISLSTGSVTDIDEILSADIVLTTYDVLKEDLSHDSDRHEGDRRLMRFQKRYPVIPTVLTRILWWRICLDEAQMVESSVTAATEMAMRLHAKHRWCITGTPIQRKLDDLYGLLRFLKTSPFDVLRWWVEVIRDPYEKGDAGAMVFTHNLFKKIMWRSSKAHVAEELQLPPQEECLSWLSLTPIEKNFYQRQHETCVTYAREVVESFKNDILERKFSDSKSSDASCNFFITQVEAAKLLNSLLKLRQACCHPQVGNSGLRSLNQSPMTMEEILMVLVGKTKVEGEEALRKLVVALNGLTGIAIIKQEFAQAVSLYKEALTVAEEHSEDFRVDPLLNIHIHHNLTEILPLTKDALNQCQSDPQVPGKSVLKIHEDDVCNMYSAEDGDQPALKKRRVSQEDSDSTADSRTLLGFPSDAFASDSISSKSCTSYQSLQLTCESLKQKFLSMFNSKLSIAQHEFMKSYGQISDALIERKSEYTTWWLEALQHIEQDKEMSAELIRKIGDAVSGTLNTSRTSRIASCFQSLTALKYYIQTGLDSLEDSRKTLLDRLLQLDGTMGNPREEDIERVRYCRNCQLNGDGPICVKCEVDELFQIYEARLFRLNKGHRGGVVMSADEAVDLQKKKSALNRFYRTLSKPDKNAKSSSIVYDDDGRKRDAGEKVTVSRSPSDLEVVLGIIKNCSKIILGRDAMSAARKQLLLLEGMRKEYAQARTLAIAQAQVLHAHDEIKMATSRLRLRENEDDNSIDVLSPDELDVASVENTSEKFLALSSLSRIKGQLRYLKSLVQSKQKPSLESRCTSSLAEDSTISTESCFRGENDCLVKFDEETCPVCQEKLSNQKMVFQCGHVTCCKCFFAMTEQRRIHHRKSYDKWVMCPTCRQPTDFGNIAYVDDKQNKSSDSSHAPKNSEASLTINGSYSTKIVAVTKRILWINSTNPKAKVLVFSSWNDVLDVLEHAFAANNISFVRMKGGRKSEIAISHFKGEKLNLKGNGNKRERTPNKNSVQVLLLLIQHGANGLNLLEAQHVILVEPLLNPAAEAQAISRVHRIGQQDRTLIHRFIVKDTVEESIYKMNRNRTNSSIISGNKKNQDQPLLTLEDVESLFKVAELQGNEKSTGELMHLPPSVAAGIAAERRLIQQTS